MAIVNLPYEMLVSICRELSVEDTFNLATTCKPLSELLTDETLCRAIFRGTLYFQHQRVRLANMIQRTAPLLLVRRRTYHRRVKLGRY